jgi:ParB-like chromosome segregation protein Spo0J
LPKTPLDLAPPQGMAAQPISRVLWLPRRQLHPNDYNPNFVAKPELNLLKVSILADGWTQPIVMRRDGEVVDGFHRWDVSEDEQVAAMTEGYVPIVFLREDASLSHQMASTIRHNRARGVHGVRPMAAIIRELIDKLGMTPERIVRELGMEREEVDRLYSAEGMPERAGQNGFSKGWVPG